MKVVTDMPLPEDQTYDSIEDLFQKLDSIHKVFSDPQISSIRLVLNLEKMVIKETQRAYTYLHLYGYPVDLVIVNRSMPKELEHPYFVEWKKSQQDYREELKDLFNPLPTLEAPLFSKEVLGIKSLEEFADILFADKDPTQIFFNGKPYEIVKEGGSYELLLKLPFISKEEVKLSQVGDELTIQIENQRRNLFLPGFLAKLSVQKANMQDGVLRIVFNKKERKNK
jgi:arsenite-transporting ATPase